MISLEAKRLRIYFEARDSKGPRTGYSLMVTMLLVNGSAPMCLHYRDVKKSH